MLALIYLVFSISTHAQVIEISGSPFATEGAPLSKHINTHGEKVVLVSPGEHAFGAYLANGKLIRWGIATAGAYQCADAKDSCHTKVGEFRIYSLGDSSCISRKYDGAPMPYCMFFAGGQALHGSSNVQFSNISHGCIRLHLDDARWLRYHFVQGPDSSNNYRGTRVIIKPY